MIQSTHKLNSYFNLSKEVNTTLHRALLTITRKELNFQSQSSSGEWYFNYPKVKVF